MATLRGTGAQEARGDVPKFNLLPSNPPEDLCQSRFYEPSTNEDILYSWRRHKEIEHRRKQERRAGTPMVLSTLGPLPSIDLDDIQDCYNKATAIYWADYRFHFKTRQSPLTYSAKAMNVIYPQWFLAKVHNTDIEFNNFVAKTINLQDTEMYRYAVDTEVYQQTVADVVKTHKSLCKRLADVKPVFESLVYPYMPKRPLLKGALFFGVDEEFMYYRLRPLFRALIIFVDNPLSEPQDLLVKLIRTGLEDNLSAPIDFDSIKPEIKSQNDDGTVVTVPIQTAIRFVTELDEREKKAFPDKEYEEGLISRSHEGLEYLRNGFHMEETYTGKDPEGPHTTWVDHSRLEAVVVPRSWV
ncbi:uncharacterized protein LY89DRAFT_765180 [Mollisia scopiformis]|uniref:Uncharacterized protein n=1 Tax=Mollisia scopiformis TaxID=149040 RepID=A0A132B7U4_MOLSC|nr:uncharacterized protein LY89DRAFT_765180 [Mollisia scopiformis]KUJ08323.1 hypothetical protein LY89DRAFT_765180 [Mollisia scopiformis]